MYCSIYKQKGIHAMTCRQILSDNLCIWHHHVNTIIIFHRYRHITIMCALTWLNELLMQLSSLDSVYCGW